MKHLEPEGGVKVAALQTLRAMWSHFVNAPAFKCGVFIQGVMSCVAQTGSLPCRGLPIRATIYIAVYSTAQSRGDASTAGIMECHDAMDTTAPGRSADSRLRQLRDLLRKDKD